MGIGRDGHSVARVSDYTAPGVGEHSEEKAFFGEAAPTSFSYVRAWGHWETRQPPHTSPSALTAARLTVAVCAIETFQQPQIRLDSPLSVSGDWRTPAALWCSV